MRRVGRMEELQNLATFLMADGCEWLTGETIAIDGAGYLATGAAGYYVALDKLTDADWERMRAMIKAHKRQGPRRPYRLMAMKPRPAATLILLRDGMEVLMLQRTQSAAFLGGAYVFPGGSLDPQDASTGRVVGLTEAQANARLKLASGGIAYYVAAVRECFEEAGVLLACQRDGKAISASRAESLMHWRKKPFREMLEAEDLYIPAGDLAYFGHWITAPGRSRRFDARFFVALAPQGQQGSHDAAETVHDVWITPREALERAARGEIELVNATQESLKDLARFTDPRAAFEHARALPEIDENRACWAQGKDGPKIFRRADAPYFEIHWSDPEETGETTYDLLAGAPKRLDRWVTRLIAPNPGADDRAGNEHLHRRRRGGDRPRACHRFAHRKNSREQEPEMDPVHPHAPRPLARRGRA